MRRSIRYGVVGALIASLVVACAPAAPAPTAGPTGSAPADAEWQKILDAAKQEGKLLVYAERFTGTEGTLINDEFSRLTGVTVDFINATGAVLVPRYQSEIKAGQPSADILEGSPLTMNTIRGEGGFLPLKDKPLPILRDPPSAWLVPLTFFGESLDVVVSRPAPMEGHIIVNTSLLPAADYPKSFREMATDPKYKGKIAWLDPSLSAAVTSFTVAQTYVGRSATLQDIWSLYNVQDAMTLPRSGDMEAAVGRGEAALATGLGSDRILSLAEANTPIKILAFPDAPLVSNPAMTGVLKTAQHPNAAMVFMNWVMSKDGQEFIKRMKKNNDSPRRDTPSYLADLLKGEVVGGGKRGPITFLSPAQGLMSAALHQAEIVQQVTKGISAADFEARITRFLSDWEAKNGGPVRDEFVVRE